MSQINSQGQFPDLENPQPSPISTSYNPQGISSHENDEDHVTCARTAATNIPAQVPVHPTAFFFRPPNDYYHYNVRCQEISYDAIERLLNKSFTNRQNIPSNEIECIFYY